MGWYWGLDLVQGVNALMLMWDSSIVFFFWCNLLFDVAVCVFEMAVPVADLIAVLVADTIVNLIVGLIAGLITDLITNLIYLSPLK